MPLFLLAEKPQVIPLIATWYNNEWGYIGDGRSVDELELKLKEYLNHDKIPLIIVAFDKSTLVGTAQLRFHEMDIYPQRAHWLGGVYVTPSSRGMGVGKALVEAIIEKAKTLGVTSINLQTEDISGGLYRSLGWQTVEQVTYHGIDVLVMEKLL